MTLSSHNVNGYKNSREFLHSRCQDETHAIFALQEHWLKPAVRQHQGVNVLKSLHPKYDGYGISAMAEKMNNEILKGRPFGGTGFLYSRNLSLSIRPLTQHIHDRVSLMELSTSHGSIILINAYLPFYDTRNVASQIALYKDTVAYIESIMQTNVNASFILLMDMNCDVYNTNHVYSKIIHEMMSQHKLISAFDLVHNFDPASEYTRCDIKTGSYTLIDGILISSSLSHIVKKVSIGHYGNNVSDHAPVEMIVDVELNLFTDQIKPIMDYIPWSSLSTDDLSVFRQTMDEKLQSIDIPYDHILHGNCNCNDVNHIFEIETYFNMVVEAIRCADLTLPRKKVGVAKHYWSDELSSLKNKSIDAFQLWKIHGCPRHGPFFHEKNTAHLNYKRGLRKAKRQCESSISDSLCNDFLSKNPDKFWKNWKNISGKNAEVSCVDGCFSHNDIANSFANTFSNVYKCSNNDAESKLNHRFDELFESYADKHGSDDLSPYYISWSEFLTCISEVSTGKATGSFIKPQHLLHGSPTLAIHLHLLFNSFIQHSYVPHEFLRNVVSPVIKDTVGDHSDSANYRPIALSSLFSQLFERVIRIKTAHLLSTDELQFGFKSKLSTNHALFTLNETVNYFTKHGSTVIAAFLDCSKAFDKISHAGVFIKLIERKVPICFVKLLIYWLSNLTSRCRWHSAHSDPYHVTSGVKQGGVLSPFIFTVYINDLFDLLRKAGVGCHILNRFLAAIMFADDLALIAPTRSAMQKMITICESYCQDHCLNFNVKKTKAMVFGNNYQSIVVEPLYLNDEPIHFVTEWKYLGCLITSGKQLAFSAHNDLRSFRCSANSILSTVKKPGEPTQMHLLYSFSVPILTYAAEVKCLSYNDMHKCAVALNDAIRRIFSFNRWESIRSLRLTLGYDDLFTIFARRRNKFTSQIRSLNNASLSLLLDLD